MLKPPEWFSFSGIVERNWPDNPRDEVFYCEHEGEMFVVCFHAPRLLTDEELRAEFNAVCAPIPEGKP